MRIFRRDSESPGNKSTHGQMGVCQTKGPLQRGVDQSAKAPYRMRSNSCLWFISDGRLGSRRTQATQQACPSPHPIQPENRQQLETHVS